MKLTTHFYISQVPDSVLARMFACERSGVVSACRYEMNSFEFKANKNMIGLNLHKLITFIYFRRDPNDGSYLIDRTPAYFEPILNFLRTGSLIINPNLNAEGINIEINNISL